MLLLNVQLETNPANDSGFGVDFFFFFSQINKYISIYIYMNKSLAPC